MANTFRLSVIYLFPSLSRGKGASLFRAGHSSSIIAKALCLLTFKLYREPSFFRILRRGSMRLTRMGITNSMMTHIYDTPSRPSLGQNILSASSRIYIHALVTLFPATNAFKKAMSLHILTLLWLYPNDAVLCRLYTIILTSKSSLHGRSGRATIASNVLSWSKSLKEST